MEPKGTRSVKKCVQTPFIFICLMLVLMLIMFQSRIQATETLVVYNKVVLLHYRSGNSPSVTTVTSQFLINQSSMGNFTVPPTKAVTLLEDTKQTEKKYEYPALLKTTLKQPGIPAHYWRTIDNSRDVQLKLFSAYFDDRESPQIYVLGFENHNANHKYYCVFQYENRQVCSEKLAKRLNTNDDVDPFKDYHIELWGFYYICNISSKEVPMAVSISLSPKCTMHSDRDWIPVDNREKRNTSQMTTFGVCVQGPVYGSTDPQNIVEFVELHKALGAEIITVYVQDTDKLVWKVLQQYVDEGVVDVINWNLTFVNNSGSVHYRGQSLLVNDCLYRNMYKVQYLAMNDLDEVIVPMGHFKRWADMISSIDRENYGGFLFCSTAFKIDHVRIEKDLLRCGPNVNNTLESINPPRYIAMDKQLPSNGYDKMILKPLFVRKTSFHRVFGFLKGSLYKVPGSIGTSYHYRIPPPKSVHRGLVSDKGRLRSLLPDVLEKIRKRVCELYTI